MANEASIQASMQRALNTSNLDILGPSIRGYPPALMDIEYAKPTNMLNKYFNKFILQWQSIAPPAWNTAQDLSELLLPFQLDPGLPLPTVSEQSVYVLTAARDHFGRMLNHWSFYSQGHVFHLTAPRSNKKQFEDDKREVKLSGNPPDHPVQVRLKVQNLVDPSSSDWVPQTAKTRQTALQAYHIGHTRFDPQQLRQLAAFVVQALDTYNIFERNCQLFVSSLAVRTVMSQRDCSVFVGSIHQFVNWDLQRQNSDCKYYSHETGYVLVKPGTIQPTKNRYINQGSLQCWPFVLWTAIRLSRRTKNIATLYSHGEHKIGAFDPSGEREGFRYVAHQTRRDLHEFKGRMQTLMPAGYWAAIWDDAKHARWRLVWRGRPEYQKLFYIDAATRAARGDAVSRFTLAFYDWSWNVTDEQRRAWLEHTEMMPTTALSSSSG